MAYGDSFPLSDPTEAQTTPAPMQAPANPSGLADQWRTWIGDPANRSALMQFGVSLAQPVGLGQTKVGQVASALGSAGEAAGRVQEQERRATEAESKDALRAAQIERAQSASETSAARSETAAARAGTAAERLGLEREKFGLQKEIQNQGINLKLRIQYSKEKNAHELASTEPFPSFDDWLAENAGGLGVGGGGAAPKGGSAAGGSAPPPAAVAHLKAHPELRVDFDAKFGVGAAARVLGQ